jgi:hypothetical protein
MQLAKKFVPIILSHSLMTRQWHINQRNTQVKLTASEEELVAAGKQNVAQKAILDQEMQACRASQQENEALTQKLAKERQEWSAGEPRRQEAARRAATIQAELELLDVRS